MTVVGKVCLKDVAESTNWVLMISSDIMSMNVGVIGATSMDWTGLICNVCGLIVAASEV